MFLQSLWEKSVALKTIYNDMQKKLVKNKMIAHKQKSFKNLYKK